MITVENLGKKYLLRHQSDQQPYVALRDVLSDGVRSLGRRLLGRGNTVSRSPGQEEFWALKDVSFEVKQGDRIGIIGRNGAGKSTLLKILSRITEPTTGSVRIRGRVASLLEVGTGFHPELTGRENIYLNGAILGMGRAEIRKKFDEIVDFAEIEKFLDTPVKRYSSGMYVRLAFAVAAHLEPEILVVDEVLAVGDAHFQHKCLGKMADVSTAEGRTVLFVSHNMAAIRSLCNRALFVSSGMIAVDGACESAISQYLMVKSEMGTWKASRSPKACDKFCFTSVKIYDANQYDSGIISSDAPVNISVEYVALVRLAGIQLAMRVTNQDGVVVFTTANTDAVGVLVDIEKGFYRDRISLPANFLPPGRYTLLLAAMKPNIELYDKVENQISFFIDDAGNHATILNDNRIGVVTPLIRWENQLYSGMLKDN